MSEISALCFSLVSACLPVFFMRFNNRFLVKRFHRKKLGDDYLYLCYLAYIVFVLSYFFLFY